MRGSQSLLLFSVLLLASCQRTHSSLEKNVPVSIATERLESAGFHRLNDVHPFSEPFSIPKEYSAKYSTPQEAIYHARKDGLLKVIIGHRSFFQSASGTVVCLKVMTDHDGKGFVDSYILYLGKGGYPGKLKWSELGLRGELLHLERLLFDRKGEIVLPSRKPDETGSTKDKPKNGGEWYDLGDAWWIIGPEGN